MKDEALKLALEALESCGAGHITDGGNQWHDEKLVDKAITAIKQALAAPVQPAAWVLTAELDKRETTTRAHLWFSDPVNCMWTPIYTTPPAQPAPVQEQVVAELERIAQEPPVNGNNLAQARVLMAAQRIRNTTPPAGENK
jgi:hypothetical protein